MVDVENSNEVVYPTGDYDKRQRAAVEPTNEATNGLHLQNITISLPSDEEILKKAKEVIPEDLYKDCGGYVTIEDRNEAKRRILIRGIKLGLQWQ